MARTTVIPFGPQHPVFPEPLQLKLIMQEERVVQALPAIGYVHRGIEKLAEQKDFHQNVFLIERVCGICSFIHSLAYCQGIEELMQVQVPDRGRYLRVAWSEMHRIHSHLLWLGLLADAFGFENVFMQVLRCRELVLDMMEETAGARILLSTCCVGGVRRDVPADKLSRALHLLDELEAELDQLVPAVLDDYSVRQRLIGVGRLSREAAHERGAVGPVARASGIAHDLREMGYAAYGELDFEVITRAEGDCYARTQVRMGELRVALSLVRQAITRIPPGPTAVQVKGNPDGEVVSRVEQPRGEVLYYLKANGSKNLDRVKIRTPTFANIPALLAMLPSCELADVPVITLSIDPCISCAER